MEDRGIPLGSRSNTKNDVKRTRNTFKKHMDLVDAGGDKGVQKILDDNKELATQVKAAMGDKVRSDNRNVTQAEVVKAWGELNDKESDRAEFKKVVGKLDKLDCRLYGIKVHDGARKKGKGLPEYGTKVVRGSAKGNVTKFRVDNETGLTVFEVKWTGGERENLGTREVLELAKGQPGVVTPGENDERVVLWICGVYCILNILLWKYLVEDNDNTTRKRYVVPIPVDDVKRMMALRKAALDKLLKTTGSEAMTEGELDLLGDSDEKLREDLGKEESFLKLLGIQSYVDEGEIGCKERTRLSVSTRINTCRLSIILSEERKRRGSWGARQALCHAWPLFVRRGRA